MAGGGIQNNIRIKALNLCILSKGIPLLLEEDLTYVAVIVVHFQVDVEQLKIFAIELFNQFRTKTVAHDIQNCSHFFDSCSRKSGKLLKIV